MFAAVVILVILALSQQAWALKTKSDACVGCNGYCALLPPANDKVHPCYQGTPADAANCFDTDPLLTKGTEWKCGECPEYGYKTFLRYDPLYTTMQLWSK